MIKNLSDLSFVAARWCVLVLSGVPFASNASEPVPIVGRVVDANTGDLIPARIAIRTQAGPDTTPGTSQWHFVISPRGSAVRYAVRNWIRADSEEFHTTVSADPFQVELPPGDYEWIVERGKEYLPASVPVRVAAGEPQEVRIPLQRWIDMASRGWYSGDTHVHRSLDELPNLLLAEDLNVAFPLTHWVTRAHVPPAVGDKSLMENPPTSLVEVDANHVFWPQNTEWEIFSFEDQRHTLGALFALGHSRPFPTGVPPIGPVLERAQEEGALLDIDKADWPWSMNLPPLTGPFLFELANNHVWRAEFAFTQWNSTAPPWMQPPLAARSGTERDWIRYTLEHYYIFLNCNLPVVPSAGTASGVHPVPLGFGRVYVHLPDGFHYEAWKRGLIAGRSFVTTGPMLLVVANGEPPGHRFEFTESLPLRFTGEVLSEQPLSFIEIIHNGVAVHTQMASNQRTPSGVYRTPVDMQLPLKTSGWTAVRCWEDRPRGRVRFAHTAAWHIAIPGHPHRPRQEERDYLVERVKVEIRRTQPLLDTKAQEEYAAALHFYEQLDVLPRSSTGQTRPPRNAADLSRWLQILREHSFSLDEMQDVTGLDTETLQEALRTLPLRPDRVPGKIALLPYPGGRHPRVGFLDGAIAPVRETKFSVFPPWSTAPGEYVVVDVPEAIWSNLGLTYLAHTHIPTVWDQTPDAGPLEALEWEVRADGALQIERTLPNGIRFGTRVDAADDHVRIELWLHNGTAATLSDLRVQNCVMLKALPGFTAQTSTNKRLEPPFALAHSDDGSRWVLTAWERCDRAWANPPVPCLHSDPRFPDLAPGETARLRGWLGFYEGSDPETLLLEVERDFGWKRN